MSRVGKVPVKLGQGVKVAVDGRTVKVEGPKGKLSHVLAEGVTAKVEKDTLNVGLDTSTLQGREAKKVRALQGVTRTVLNNMVKGVSAGFQEDLDIVGVGFRAAVKGNVLSLTIGYSHGVDYKLPEGITAKVDNNTHIVLNGADKILLGMTAAKIRGFRPPEPYQGKGIKYTDEHIIRKVGKAAATGSGGK